jgi:hypothetical protein
VIHDVHPCIPLATLSRHHGMGKVFLSFLFIKSRANLITGIAILILIAIRFG